MLKSIQVLLSITTHFDYKIWQIDDKIVFLNDNLEEDIYMMQTNSSLAKAQEHMVCKLHRSIYRFKQES